MKSALLLPLLLAAGCLDFSILGTPLDGGAGPTDGAAPSPDLQSCLFASGRPSECTSGTDCPPGHDCVSSGGNAPGVCLRQCNIDRDCPCAGSFCVGAGGGDTFCSTVCDLAADTGCPAKSTCDIQTDDNRANVSFTFCRGLGPTATGGTCNLITDCGANDSCVGVNQGAQCLRWCNILDGKCPNNGTCVVANPGVDFRNMSYGFCQ